MRFAIWFQLFPILASANIQFPTEGKLDVCPPAYIRRQCLLFVAKDGHDCRHTERDPPHTGQRYGGACRIGLGKTGSHERCGICRGGIGSGGVRVYRRGGLPFVRLPDFLLKVAVFLR